MAYHFERKDTREFFFAFADFLIIQMITSEIEMTKGFFHSVTLPLCLKILIPYIATSQYKITNHMIYFVIKCEHILIFDI